MRKLVSLILVLSMALCFIGCSKKSETIFVANKDGIEEKITLYAKGDIIERIVTTSTISLEGYPEELITQLEIKAATQEIKFNAIKGVTYYTQKTDNTYTVTFDLDVSNDENLQAITDSQLIAAKKEGKYLSYKETKKGFESMGYTEIKE